MRSLFWIVLWYELCLSVDLVSFLIVHVEQCPCGFLNPKLFCEFLKSGFPKLVVASVFVICQVYKVYVLQQVADHQVSIRICFRLSGFAFIPSWFAFGCWYVCCLLCLLSSSELYSEFLSSAVLKIADTCCQEQSCYQEEPKPSNSSLLSKCAELLSILLYCKIVQVAGFQILPTSNLRGDVEYMCWVAEL